MKRLLSLALTILLCGMLSACNNGGSGSSASDLSSSKAEAVSTQDDDPSTSAPAQESAGSENTSREEAGNAGGSINLYTWEGMFQRELLDAFTAETGIAVNYVNFDYDENMLAKLETEKGGTYDLIIADDYIIETAIAEGLVGKLDQASLSNLGNVNPLFQGQFFDPTDEYTVPFGAGVQTIVYNPALTDLDIKSYADLFDESLADSIGLIANYRVVNGIGLKMLGESYNTENLPVIEEAGTRMLDLAPNVRLIKDDNLQDDLISGEVTAAVMYTSQVTQAMLADPSLELVYPTEGLGFGIMGGFVPVNAPNAEGAHLFLDYFLRPEVSAEYFEALGYYCTTKPAEDLIADEYKEFLTLPGSFTASDMEMIGNINAEALEAHEKIWTSFKAACGQ